MMASTSFIGSERFLTDCGISTMGLVLTAAGVMGLRALLAEASRLGVDVARLIKLDAGMVAITLTVAVAVTVCAGLYPTWRASQVHPALQLKVQ